MNAVLKPDAAPPLKLDLGCGKNKKPGFTGVDRIKFEGVDEVCDLRKKWPWADGSVTEVHCSHFLEHLAAMERIHFANELWRVLIPGGSAQIIVPHWCSSRAYGDMTHQWPPVSEFWFWYLDKNWRAVNAPHDDAEHNPKGYRCDFEFTQGYGIHGELMRRSGDYQQFALQFWKEAAQDIHATLKARK